MLKLKLQTLATWFEEQIHWKRPWCWERLRAGWEGGSRGWDGWMVSLTQWTWILANSRSFSGGSGILKSLLQHHNSKASVLWHSAFFYAPTHTSVHDYLKNHSFDNTTIQTFAGKVMSPLFNTLSRSVIAFLPRSKCLFIYTTWETDRDGGYSGIRGVDDHAQAPLKLFAQGSQTFPLRAGQQVF